MPHRDLRRLRAQPLDLTEAVVGRAQFGHLLLEVPDDPMALQPKPLARCVGARCVRLSVTGEVPLHGRREASRVDGLLDEAIATDGEARITVPLRRNGDDGDPVERRLTAAQNLAGSDLHPALYRCSR